MSPGMKFTITTARKSKIRRVGTIPTTRLATYFCIGYLPR